MIRVTHNAGFFSCCTVRLLEIIGYFNIYKKLPCLVDSSEQFSFYKSQKNQDLTYKFFEKDGLPNTIPYKSPVEPLLVTGNVHFPNYKNVNYTALAPFVSKYFSPSTEVKKIIIRLENKYKLDYNKTCLVYYRGNDKALEVHCPGYQEMVDKTSQVKKEHPEIRFLVQTDEREFLQYFIKHFPNSIYLTEIEPINKRLVNPGFTLPIEKREDFARDFLAVIYFLSKVKYIITTTHNAAFWLCLFRGHSNDVYQYLRFGIGIKNRSRILRSRNRRKYPIIKENSKSSYWFA